MNIKLLTTVLILMALVYGAVVYLGRDKTGTGTGGAANEQARQTVEDYVRTNISKLSPSPEVLGGTFYVTKIEARGGVGVVWYEDGHNAYVADFKYSADEYGNPSISAFTVRQ